MITHFYNVYNFLSNRVFIGCPHIFIFYANIASIEECQEQVCSIHIQIFLKTKKDSSLLLFYSVICIDVSSKESCDIAWPMRDGIKFKHQFKMPWRGT